MKVTIEMENLNKIIEEVVKTNTEEAIQEAIRDIARNKVDEVLGDTLSKIVNDHILNYVDDYLKTTKIHIGGGWSNKDVEEYTAEEYLRKQIKEIFESKTLQTCYKDKWGDSKIQKITFQEYVEQQLNAEQIVKPHIDKMAKEVKDEVNYKIKTLFDGAMRNTLAENVFTIVSASETYKSVSNSLKMLGD